MKFDESYFERLPTDPLEALRKLANDVKQFHARRSEQSEITDDYEDYLNALAMYDAVTESHNLLTGISHPELQKSLTSDVYNIVNFFDLLFTKLKESNSTLIYESSKSKFAAKLGKGFFYEFSEGDLRRVQSLINELRDSISKSANLEEGHRRRLLLRLERLQSEMHKKLSDLDRFWGLVGDAGVVLGKLGKDAKPIVDRIREIAEIIWRTQSRAEELPSDSPQPLLTRQERHEE